MTSLPGHEKLYTGGQRVHLRGTGRTDNSGSNGTVKNLKQADELIEYMRDNGDLIAMGLSGRYEEGGDVRRRAATDAA